VAVGPPAALSGAGTVRGDLTNAGALAVGQPGVSGPLTGTLEVTGNYTQAATGSLALKLAGPGGNDLLQVDGAAALGGTLNVSLLGTFIPSAGQSFYLIEYASRSGTFATLNLPSYSGGALVAQYDLPPGTFSLLAT
jgi:hypothetical protein